MVLKQSALFPPPLRVTPWGCSLFMPRQVPTPDNLPHSSPAYFGTGNISTKFILQVPWISSCQKAGLSCLSSPGRPEVRVTHLCHVTCWLQVCFQLCGLCWDTRSPVRASPPLGNSVDAPTMPPPLPLQENSGSQE